MRLGAGIVLAIAFIAQFSLVRRDLSVWVCPSLERISQTEEPSNVRDIVLSAARGEVESFQIAVRSESSGASVGQILFSDLHDKAGHAIPASVFTLYTEHYVEVSPGSPDLRGKNRPLGKGWYADALIPFVSPELTAGRNQPFWVDVSIPRETNPGPYRGTYTVMVNGVAVTGSIDLTVWNFVLPHRPALKSSFGTNGDSHRRAVEVELLKNRLAPAQASVEDEREYIDQYGMSSVGLGFWSGANYGNCSMSAPPAIRNLQRERKRHAADLQLYNYSADEIDACAGQFEMLKEWARNLHAAGVPNLVTMTPTSELLDDGTGTGRSAVDVWVLLPRMYDRAVGAVETVKRKGDEVWSYNTLSQDDYSPKWLIDYPPVDFRVQPGFISQSLGLTGLLYWRVDFWHGPHWDSVNNFGTFGEYNAPGDGMLVYRLDAMGIDGVAPSMRLKWLRDGVEDYEYVELLKNRGAGEWALGLARSAGRNWTDWSRDPSVLQSVRQKLGERLDQLAGNGAK